MIFPTFFLSMMLAAVDIPQDQYMKADFEFTNGDKASLVCGDDQQLCSISMRVFDRQYTFDARTPGMTRVFPIIPRRIDIIRLDADKRMFTFGIEYECQSREEKASAVICSANVHVADGRVLRIDRYAVKEQFSTFFKDPEAER